MSVERKYDGEYCKIHINLSKDNDPIRIFPRVAETRPMTASGYMARSETALDSD
jgi:hypothetical protein